MASDQDKLEALVINFLKRYGRQYELRYIEKGINHAKVQCLVNAFREIGIDPSKVDEILDVIFNVVLRDFTEYLILTRKVLSLASD